MDSPRDYLTKYKSDRGRQIYHTCTWKLKNSTNELNIKNRNKLTEIESKLMITKGRGNWSRG